MTGQVLLKAADLHKAYGPNTALAGPRSRSRPANRWP
jgi:hypothetical protein